MLTRNYIKYRRMMFTNSNQSFVSYDGSTITAKISSSYNNDLGTSAAANIYTSEGSASGTYFGTGRTPATLDDYKLESFIPKDGDGLTFKHAGYALYEESAGHYVFDIRTEITNTTAENKTIGEMGLFRYVSDGNDSTYCMMDRTVPPEPIVIAPGETRLVTYRINFNQSMV